MGETSHPPIQQRDVFFTENPKEEMSESFQKKASRAASHIIFSRSLQNRLSAGSNIYLKRKTTEYSSEINSVHSHHLESRRVLSEAQPHYHVATIFSFHEG